MQSTVFKIMFLCLLSLRLTGALAQSSAPAAGGDASGGGGSASYTVGQAVFTAVDQAGGSVIQGVQQPYEIFSVGATSPPGLRLQCAVRPNPTATDVLLTADPLLWGALSVALYDAGGRLLFQQQTSDAETRIPMAELPAAVYFLTVSNDQGAIQSFQIIKIH